MLAALAIDQRGSRLLPLTITLCVSPLPQTSTKLPHLVGAFNCSLMYFISMGLPATSPISVLVIESHPLMREALIISIADEPGWAVAGQFNAGEETVTAILSAPPDLIVLAVGNPGLDDLELMSALRPALPALPILALTTGEGLPLESDILQAGANSVMTKAAARDEIRHEVQALLKSHKPNTTDANSIGSPIKPIEPDK